MGTSVRYRVTGAGWAECEVELDGQSLHLTPSYVTDALDDLLRAMVDLLRGVPYVTIFWTEEPTEYRWRFDLKSPERVFVQILRFPNYPSRLPDEAGEPVLAAECRLRTLAGTILAASQRVLLEQEPEQYAQEWRRPFPFEWQVELKRLLEAGAGRPCATGT